MQQFFEPAVPYAAHAVASAGAFYAGLVLTQATGYVLRVSSATPVLASVLGTAGVGLASAMAGQASLYCRHKLSASPAARPPTWKHPKQVALDALIGIALYKMMGGRFRRLLPSDLFREGALAVESLRAPGPRYAQEAARGELRRIMRRDGCHHCGRRVTEVVGDHIPPNKIFQVDKARAMGRHSVLAGAAQRLLAALQVDLAPSIAQRYYAQCRRCSAKQAQAVRTGVRTLIWHHGGPRSPYYAGVLVGMRYYCGPALGM